MRIIFTALVIVLCTLQTAWADATQRVVSLNLCADVLALNFARQGQLQAVSFNAADPELSTVAQEAQTLTLVRGSAEEMLALNPDLVLMGEGQQPHLQHWLKAQGIAVHTLGVAQSLDELAAQMVEVAAALGNEEAALTEIRLMEQAFAIPYRPDIAPRVAIYYPRGYSDGAGTFMDALLARMGAEHIGARQGWSSLDYVPLEQMIAQQPDLLLTQAYGFSVQTQGEVLLHHPALARMGSTQVVVPGQLLICPHLNVPDIVAQIQQEWPPRRNEVAHAH